jgi:hypothetical protein
VHNECCNSDLRFSKYWIPSFSNKAFLCYIKVQHVQCIINSFLLLYLKREEKKFEFAKAGTSTNTEHQFLGKAIYRHKMKNYYYLITMIIHLHNWEPTDSSALFLCWIPASKVTSRSERRDDTCKFFGVSPWYTSEKCIITLHQDGTRVLQNKTKWQIRC